MDDFFAGLTFSSRLDDADRSHPTTTLHVLKPTKPPSLQTGTGAVSLLYLTAPALSPHLSARSSSQRASFRAPLTDGFGVNLTAAG